MRFPPGTSVTEARHEVLDSEFPSDAHGKLRTLGSCAPMSVKSGTLRREAHTSATVEFSSGDGDDSYDPSDVWQAIVSFGGLAGC